MDVNPSTENTYDTVFIKKRTRSLSSFDVHESSDTIGSIPDPDAFKSVEDKGSPRRSFLIKRKICIESLLMVALVSLLLLLGYVVAPQVSALALGCAEMYRAVLDWNGLSGGVYMAFLADHKVMDGWMKDGVTGYRSNVTHSRGILIPAGGKNQLLNAFTNLHVLRNHLKCTLPVTIAYWGKIEKEKIDQDVQKVFQKHIGEVSFLDLSTVQYPKHQRLLHIQNTVPSKYYGFKVKVFALYAAPYKQVLLMDSDSMALQNPEHLFEAASFVKHGNMFWPDRWCTPVDIFDKISSIVENGDDTILEQQTDSGQLLFDRERHRDVLEWLLFLNTHEEFTYRYAYGDKDTYRAAFLLSKKGGEYYQVEQRLSIGLRSFLFLKNNPQGFIQHHPHDNSLLFIHRTSKAKYDVSDEERRNFEYILMQPSCEWNQKYWHFFRPMIFFHNHAAAPCKHSTCPPVLVDKEGIPSSVQECQYHADEAAQLYRFLISIEQSGTNASRLALDLWHFYVLLAGVLLLYVCRVLYFTQRQKSMHG